MKKILCLILLATAVTLGGCASGQKFDQVATSIPVLKKNEGRIYFYREAGIGLAVQPDIRLNDQVVGVSKPDGFFYVDRPSGDYTVATKTEVENTVSFHLDKGETKYIRTSVGMGILVGHVTPTIEPPEAGSLAIRSLAYTGQ